VTALEVVAYLAVEELVNAQLVQAAVPWHPLAATVEEEARRSHHLEVLGAVLVQQVAVDP